MKRVKASAVHILALVMLLAVIESPGSASNWKYLKVQGLGATIDYSRSEHLDDGGIFLSYRGGLAQIISGFVAFDAGYRFKKKSMNFRGGVAGMIMFVGLETGFAGVWNMKNDLDFDDGQGAFAPGMYVGLAGVLPERDFAVFLSLGGNFYFKAHEHEFYLAATAVINFADN